MKRLDQISALRHPPSNSKPNDRDDRREQDESLTEETRAILEEARMVLPGVQALFGFQLIVVFNSRFAELAEAWQVLHLVALATCAVAMSLLMTPAAYHRIAMRGRLSGHFTAIASRLIAGAMAPLALSIGIDSFLVSAMIVDNSAAAFGIAGVLLATFVSLWFVWPVIAGRRGRG